MRRRGDGRTKPLPGSGLLHGHPLARGLVGCWLFNEGSGTRANDIAHGNHGLLGNGTAAAVPRWQGQGIWFDGMTSYIQVPYTSGLRPPQISVVASFVWNGDTASNHDVCFHLWNGLDGPSYISYGMAAYRTAGPASSMGIGVTGGIAEIPVTTPTAEALTHWAMTADGTRFRGYINQQLQFDVAAAGPVYHPTSDPLRIGCLRPDTPNFHPFAGSIYLVQIWSRALLPSEVQWLHAEPYCMIDY